MPFNGFSPETYDFLDQLRVNNTRVWFNDNKARYERLVREPALDFIADMADPLTGITGQYVASPRRSGGSLMRVYRDTRFGNDKTPYKTNIGIQFRHRLVRDVHAPGFYVHIATDGVFLGVGSWRPASGPLGRIREAVAMRSEAWLEVRDRPSFQNTFRLAGERLKTAPRGYAKDHALLEDLRRKDFLGVHDMDSSAPLQADFVEVVADRFSRAASFVAFLCQALELEF